MATRAEYVAKAKELGIEDKGSLYLARWTDCQLFWKGMPTLEALKNTGYMLDLDMMTDKMTARLDKLVAKAEPSSDDYMLIISLLAGLTVAGYPLGNGRGLFLFVFDKADDSGVIVKINKL
jgi:hypothetical protein